MTYLRFEFNPTAEGIKKFFNEELSSLGEALGLLYLTGAKIDYVDFDNKKIHMKHVPDFLDANVETKEEITDNEPLKTNKTADSFCGNCKSYKATSIESGFCNYNRYSTKISDTCPYWNK